MPVSYSLNSELLQLTAAGQYEPMDIPRQLVAALDDPACPSSVALLLDVRESGVLSDRTSAQIRDVSVFLEPYAERIGRRCAVVASRDVHFELARMGAVFCEDVGVEANVFRTMEEAVEWLNP